MQRSFKYNGIIASLIGLGLGIISLLVYAIFDFPYAFLIPILGFMLLFALLRLDKFAILIGALAPLSINVDDVGAGLGMAFPTEPLIILLFALLIFYYLKHFTIPLELIKNPMVLLVLAYILWLWISSIFSVQPWVSFKFAFSRTWYIVVFFFGGLWWFRKQSNIRFFLIWQVVFTVALALYTIIKHAEFGFVRGASYGISWPFFPDHGMYAACLAFAIPILCIFIFNAKQFNLSKIGSGFIIGAFATLLFAIVTSYTRATWLSLVAALAVYFILYLKIKFRYILIALVLIGSIGLAKQDQILYSLSANKQGSSDELEGHVKSVSNITTDPSNMERFNRWSCALRMAEDKPFFGFGPGTFVFEYGAYQKSNELTIISTFFGELGDAHSEYFSALAEMGYPGMILWAAIFLYSVALGFKVYYGSKNRQIRNTALIALLALITYYVHAFLNNYSQYDKVAVPLWCFLSILVCLDLYSKNQARVEQE